MNALYIVTVYVVIDDSLKALGHRDDCRAQVTTAEILTVAVVAARYFQNHHERALCVLQLLGAIPPLSISRFNRRLHQAGLLWGALLEFWADHRPPTSLYCIDTFPLPVCERVRAARCRKVQGKAYWGRCVAKRTWFYGLRLHWVCDRTGFPIAFDFLPAVCHEFVPLHMLLAALPSGAHIVGDGAYIHFGEQALALTAGQRLILPYYPRMNRKNTRFELRLLGLRSRIEAAHSQLAAMGTQRLHACTFDGFILKALASLAALACNHFLPTSN